MATVKQYVKPQRLYRYRSLRAMGRELSAIRQGYVHCAPFEDLNDPMEGFFSSSRLLREREEYREFRRAIRDRKAQSGICSFSEVYNHELMWAHYADQFQGICIAYSLSRLLANLDKNVSFVRMYYSETEPMVRHTDKSAGQAAKKILSYKNYKWLYEREWRMFAPLGNAYYNDASCITRVYLGSRIDRDKRNQLKDALDELNIGAMDMTIDKYSIAFEPYREEDV